MKETPENIKELKCPRCGSHNVKTKPRDVGAGNEKGMPAKPPEKPLRCNNCDCEFGYGESGSRTQKQS